MNAKNIVFKKKEPLGFGPKNWFSSASPGDWTFVTPGSGSLITIGTYAVAFLFFGLLMTFLQNLRGALVGSFYLILLLVSGFFVIYTRSNPEGLISTIDFGPIGRWELAVPIALGLGLLFTVYLQFNVGAFIPFENIAVFGIPVELILQVAAPVIAIPVAEEAFFGGLLTPTLAEYLGIVPSAVLVGLVWILWHLGTYQSSTQIIVALFIFRFIATFAILYTKSLVSSLIAHMIINFVGTFFTL